MIWLINCVFFILFANKISGQQGVKQIHSRYINNARDALIEKLVEDVKNLTIEIKILKDAASQTNFVGEEKNATFDDNEETEPNGNDGSSTVLNDEATVETEATEVINKNLQQNGKTITDVREKHFIHQIVFRDNWAEVLQVSLRRGSFKTGH